MVFFIVKRSPKMSLTYLVNISYKGEDHWAEKEQNKCRGFQSDDHIQVLFIIDYKT